jgi:hypothetical protein
MNAIWDPAALAQGFWQGVFELLALSIIAAFGTFIFQRRQARYTWREELIDSINQFAINLYKPRKLYQAIIDQTCDPLAHIADASHREARRLETIYRALEDVVAATGQFRVVQVKLIPLYGHTTRKSSPTTWPSGAISRRSVIAWGGPRRCISRPSSRTRPTPSTC